MDLPRPGRRPSCSKHLATIGHDTFMKLLSGTFHQNAHAEDSLALLKRANVVIFCQQAVHFENGAPVVHYPEAKGSHLLTDDVSERMAAYKRGRKVAPPSDGIQRSLALADKCMNQVSVEGFRYEVVWGEGGSAKPQIKEIKPNLEIMDADRMEEAPAYVPRVREV